MVTEASLRSQNTAAGWEEAKTFLTAYEGELHQDKSVQTEQALFTPSRRNNRRPFNNQSQHDRLVQQNRGQSQRSKSFDGKCHNCGKKGHRKADCWQGKNKHGGARRGNPNNGWQARGRDQSGATDGQIWYSEEQEEGVAEWEAANSTYQERGRGRERDECEYLVERALKTMETMDGMKWMLDSGCTNHMTGCRHAFVEESYVSFRADRPQMKTVSGELISVVGIGSVKTHIWTPRGGRENLLLTEVYHVPIVKEMGLISVDQLTEQGIKMEYTDDTAEFYKDGILIVLAEKCIRLFKLLQEERRRDFGLLVSRKDKRATDLWYHRLGHLHLPAVLKMCNTEAVDRMPCLQGNNNENRCTASLMGKMTCTPFKPSTCRTNSPLELIHSDLCGPMQSRSLGGFRYFMLFVNNYTKFMTVYFLKSKDEAASQCPHFKAAVENFLSDKGYQTKVIRIDGGGEYSSGEFQRELKNSGIEWQVTVPYTPEVNGVAENSNRVLVGRTNALIQHADAPKNHWAEALLTTVYLKNISLTKGPHGKDITPYELWHSSKPDIKHLRVWGCTVYAFRAPSKTSR